MSPASSSPNERRRTRTAYRKLGLEALEDRLALSTASLLPIAGDWDGNGCDDLLEGTNVPGSVRRRVRA